MENIKVTVHPSAHHLAREDQLAWKLAALATDPVAVEPDVTEMIINRIIDNAGVAMAAINRGPVATARAQALLHPRNGGAAVFGLPPATKVHAEWAAWANGTAVRELDFHDTFLAADYSHPGDNIPPLLAVAQQLNCSGADLIRGVATAYEVQIDLVKGICLHAHKIDHIAHLGPAAAAGLGAMLNLGTEVVYQAVQQALHVTVSTRQSRKGEISSWKAFAPSHAGKLAVEAVDRAMRGEGAPSPIYEGEDSVIAWILDGPDAAYDIPLPAPGEPKRAILESYTKAHSAEYQAQALIDLAFRVRPKIDDWEEVEKIVLHTSHHTHYVIGSGAGDPQKMDPKASRETLDHSIMYILAVALQDGKWHHVDSYAPERAAREDTVRLWHKIETAEDAAWTERYHHPDPNQRAFGGRLEVTLSSGETVVDELAVADAHPAGANPFERADYIGKFRTLVEGLVSEQEAQRFIDAAEGLADISPGGLDALNVALDAAPLIDARDSHKGIF